MQVDRSSLKEQVGIIRQAFGYIDRFKDQIFVIKIDGTLIENQFFPIMIKDIVLLHHMGIRVILVPGARNRIDEVLATYKIECPTINGIRVSPPEAIPFIKMAAFDVSNKLMTLLAENGANAVIGNWVRARSIGVRDGIDFQSSGIVEKFKIDIIKNVLEDNLIPIFPNIGWSATGKPYNLSSNELAFNLSTEVKASKLFFITDQEGFNVSEYKVPDNVVQNDGLISQLTTEQAGAFLDLNTDKYNEQLEMISFAYRACCSGVDRVHLIDGRADGMILKEIFSNRGFGTMIYSNQHENFRPMNISDIPEVLHLMQPVIEEKILVPRTAADLEEKVSEYTVYEVDDTVHACGALHVYPDKQGEIAAIVVDEMYAGAGIGKKMITFLIEKAVKLKLKQVFVLTTQTADWFVQLGFTEMTIDELPEAKRESYNRKRNSLILKYRLSGRRTKGTY
ncbi:MAG TPA: amino-acid N-acetyltransferase [Chitinispirillaceae bacterium]|nr:amino-acid N-acetyltransferase [Chitinispirillaceae bacterium]